MDATKGENESSWEGVMDSSKIAARDHQRSNDAINLASNGSRYVQYMWLLITQPWGVRLHWSNCAFAFRGKKKQSLSNKINHFLILTLNRQKINHSIGIQRLIYQVWKGWGINISQHEMFSHKIKQPKTHTHTHSGSAIDAIRLPVRISDVGGCSCNWSRLVQTGLSGICKSNSNGKSYNVTQPSTRTELAMRAERTGTGTGANRRVDPEKALQDNNACLLFFWRKCILAV